MPDEAPQKNDVQKPKSKLPLKTILILASVFLLEAGGISFFWIMHRKNLNPAEGTDPVEATQQNENNKFAEVVLAEDFSIDNYVGGNNRLIVTLEVAAKVETNNKEKLDNIVEEHRKEILSTIRVLVSSAQPDEIKDPKKQVIIRELKSGIEIIVGEGLVEEILLPSWQTYAAN